MIVPDFEPIIIPVSFPTDGYILVNKSGERFMNENRPDRHGFGHKEILLQFDGLQQTFSNLPCYAVFDETTRLAGPINAGANNLIGWFKSDIDYSWSSDNSAEVQKGWISKGTTLAEIAQAVGVNSDTLEATVNRFNQFCVAENDEEFGRTRLKAVATAPYYAVAIYPMMYNTQGGPRRNARCQVVRPSGYPIARLYSAGELGSFWGWMYNGGGNNAECMCTGRIAARNVVTEANWDETSDAS